MEIQVQALPTNTSGDTILTTQLPDLQLSQSWSLHLENGCFVASGCSYPFQTTRKEKTRAISMKAGGLFPLSAVSGESPD